MFMGMGAGIDSPKDVAAKHKEKAAAKKATAKKKATTKKTTTKKKATKKAAPTG